MSPGGTSRPRAVAAPAKGLRPGTALRTLAGFEVRWHARDFFAWLAALVFFLLTFGHASTGVVMLVDGLGAVPRNAPWALAQAMAGVTAFGQVITAMTAATTVLRDAATRTQDLLLTTPLRWRTYLAGRFLGTVLVLAAIYAAIPLGLVLGDAVAAWRGDPARVAFDVTALLRPLGWLIAPNVLVVAAAFFAAGALTGGFAVILFVGLGLVGLWQTGLALAADGHAVGALLDPFGSAALQRATQGWTDAERAVRPMPVTALLWANRVIWLAVGGAAMAATFAWWRPRQPGGDTGRWRGRGAVAPYVPLAATPIPRARRGPTPGGVVAAEFRFGWRWVTRERGFGALLLLALLNATANGWRVADDPTALVRTIEFHARLFGILLATIYAGELVWRDRDVRANALLDALPAREGLRLLGRTLGVLAALQALPLVLWIATLLLPAVTGGVPTPGCAARWLLGVSAPAFALLLLVSLGVHRVVGHKTVAHLLCIGTWVVAVALSGSALAGPWSAWGVCG
jgi:hypothetical protein